MAGVAGFEPAAYGFGDRCSTSLSYTPARLLSTHSTLFPYSWSTSMTRSPLRFICRGGYPHRRATR